MRTILLLVFLGLAGCALPPVNRNSSIPLGDVTEIEPARYVGTWYEIARLPNSFEEDCEGVTAQYAQRPDGKISVLNTCRAGTPSGKARDANGVARIVDPTSNAKLKVGFFGPFEGDYWVLDRAEDYSWSIVGEPSGRFLWVLSRAPVIDADLKADLMSRLLHRGYDTTKLHWTRQPPS